MMEYSEVILGSAADVTVDQPLHNVYFKLTQIFYGLEDLKLKGSFTTQELAHLQNKLHAIDETYKGTVIKKAGKIPAGQAVISELLEEAHELAHELACKLGKDEQTESIRSGLFEVDESLRNLYIRLLKTYDDLEDWSGKAATTRDLGLLQNRLNEIDQHYSEAAFHKKGDLPAGQAIVAELLEKCHSKAHEIAIKLETAASADELRTGIYQLDESLRGTYVKLLTIIDALDDLKVMGSFGTRDVGRLMNKISAIDERYQQAAIKKKGHIPEGQAIVVDLLEKAHEKAHECAGFASTTPSESALMRMPEIMRGTYLKLLGILDALEALKTKDEISIREVGALQNKLNNIESHYHDAAIRKAGQIPPGQAVIAELLNEARETAHEILCSLPPMGVDVDESLRGDYYKLALIIGNLKDLKEEGIFTSRDIGLLQNKLSKIDDHYKQAALRKGGTIPAGQAILSEMIHEAHELAHELVCMLPDEQAIPAEAYSSIDEEIVFLIESMNQLHSKPHLRKAEVVALQNKLADIEKYVAEKNIHDNGIRIEIDKAYGLVFELLMEVGAKKDLSTEIDESLWPIETELKKVIHSLHELKKKPINHLKAKELKYAQEKLREVDDLYAEGSFGKFIQMQEPAKGQAVLSSMLNRAHTMLHDLQSRLPEEE